MRSSAGPPRRHRTPPHVDGRAAGRTCACPRPAPAPHRRAQSPTSGREPGAPSAVSAGAGTGRVGPDRGGQARGRVRVLTLVWTPTPGVAPPRPPVSGHSVRLSVRCGVRFGCIQKFGCRGACVVVTACPLMKYAYYDISIWSMPPDLVDLPGRARASAWISIISTNRRGANS